MASSMALSITMCPLQRQANESRAVAMPVGHLKIKEITQRYVQAK